jgi:hypothetical protein
MSKRKTLASDTYSSSDSEDNDTEPPSDREIEPLTEEADESDSKNRDDQNEPTETSIFPFRVQAYLSLTKFCFFPDQ